MRIDVDLKKRNGKGLLSLGLLGRSTNIDDLFVPHLSGVNILVLCGGTPVAESLSDGVVSFRGTLFRSRSDGLPPFSSRSTYSGFHFANLLVSTPTCLCSPVWGVKGDKCSIVYTFSLDFFSNVLVDLLHDFLS